MPLGPNLGGNNKGREINKSNNIIKEYLTMKPADYIYRKVELGSLINKNTMKEEIDQDVELDKMHNTSGDKNPYRELIVNNAGKIENTLSQMEQWSILSNVINYVQYSKNPKHFHVMSVKSIDTNKTNIGRKQGEKDRPTSEVSLVDTSHKLTEEYSDRYEGVKSEIVVTTRFDENSDLSMTYLGKINMIRDHKIAAEEKFPMSEQGYTTGKLLDGTECEILLGTRASKSFMSKSHYLHCKSLHSLPKFASKTQRIQVDNGQYVSVLFIILIIIDIHGHRFEIYTLVSKIHENIDIVLGITNVFKLEGVTNSQECSFSFLNGSIPLFPKEEIILKAKEQKLIKVEAPFLDKISGLAIIKLLDRSTQSTIMLKVTFMQNGKKW